MRLPVRYRTRWVYALLSGVVGLLFCLLFFGALEGFQKPNPDVSKWLIPSLFGLSAAPAAALAWPRRSPRSKLRMFAAGCLTVLLGFIVIGLGFGLLTLLEPSDEVWSSTRLLMIVPVTGMVIMIGSMITLGMPYLLGGVFSLLFTDPPEER